MPELLSTPATFVEALARLEARAERGVGVLDRRGRTVSRPYPELALRARAWGAWFRERGVRAGDVVFLCLPSSHELLEAFCGLVLLRALPCNLALPRALGGLDSFRRRLVSAAERFPGGQLLTSADVGQEVGRPFWEPPAELDLSRVVALEPVDPDTPAYVQLTSGSTQAPKAVTVTHGNVAANTRGIWERGVGHPDEYYVSWLPLYHDMGLLGMAFTAMFHGVGLTLMTPETFVASPWRWLEAIGQAPGSVVTTAPNFGYQWCVDRLPEERLPAGLRLDNWRLALCGAEMVRPATLQAFAARFGPRGFDERAFLPCYGMAETTLAITLSPARRGPVLHQGRVSCGSPIAGLEVRVCAPGGRDPLPEGQEGEIQARGSSVFPGYLLDPEATAAVKDPDGWFRTGDLGYLQGGELYPTGRLKDLIILAGHNVAPHELEWVAEELLPLEGGRAAAFSVERQGAERPVLVVELREVPAPELLEQVRARVAREVAPLHDLVLVRRGTLPKTSSGKVQRSKVREAYEAGTLPDVLWRWSEVARPDQEVPVP